MGDAWMRETPWDRRVFAVPTYEITEPTEEALRHASVTPGHFTVKCDPLADTRLLRRFGFYYCDTLLEPFCDAGRFVDHQNPSVTVSRNVALEEVLNISRGAYEHGRFHRDLNLPRELADRRYDQWTADLHGRSSCLGLYYQGRLAAYIGHTGGHFALHAVAPEFRGKGIAKYLWSAACREFFTEGVTELTSSVSASNVAVVNLYISLGFRMRNPHDVYHRFNEPA